MVPRSIGNVLLGLALASTAGCSGSLPPSEEAEPTLVDLDDRARRGDPSIVPAILDGLDSDDPGVRAHRYLLLVAVWERHFRGAPAPLYDPFAPRAERLQRIEEMRLVLERLKLSGAGGGDTAWSDR